MESQSTFFRPGGTLEPGAECYIERKADEQLLTALMAGDYVFLLDSRQKGKSSLIARSILKLREAGGRQVRLDLQRIGANVTPEQWYAGLAVGVGQELGLQNQILEYWEAHQAVGPLARFIGALQEVVLPNTAEPLVIFVDEVDFVRALTFPTDEFFAGIRECYNRRSSDESLKRLTFCLVGVATPGQLIRNPDVSPFNIGVRIDLTDFTLEETSVYAGSMNGRRDGAKLVAMVHYWVSGHPYLTQLLCGRIASDPSVVSPHDVDRLVRTLFLSPESRQREPNLSDVERRILDPDVPGLAVEEGRVQVLELYGRMLKAKSVEAVEQNPVVATLRLSGVGLEHDGILQVRNRVYRSVFDQTWRLQNLPDAEVRRQTGASRRATLRTTAVAAVVVFAVATAAVGFFNISKERESALTALGRQSEELRLKNYLGLMASIWIAVQESRWTRVSELIDESKNDPLRGWEWGHVAKLVNGHVAEDSVDPRNVFERDPDGSLSLVTQDSIYSVTSAGLVPRRKFVGRAVVPLSRKDNLRLGVDAVTGRFVLRNVDTDEVVKRENLQVISFDPKSRTVVVYRGDHVLLKLDFNGKTIQVVGSADRSLARIVELANGGELKVFRDGRFTRTDAKGRQLAEAKIPLPQMPGVQQLVTSADDTLFTHIDAGRPRPVQVRRMSDLTVLVTLDAPSTMGGVRAFAPDNRSILASNRGEIVLYDLKSGKSLQRYPGHKAEIVRLEFLRGGQHFASIDRQGGLRIWPLKLDPVVEELATISDPPGALIRCDDPDVILYRTLGEALESRNLRTGRVSRLPQPAGSGSHEPFAVVSGTKVFVGTESGRVDRYSADGLVKEKSVQVFKSLVYGMGILWAGKRLLVRSNIGKPHPGVNQGPPHTSAEYAVIDTDSLAILHRFSPEWPLPGVNYKGFFTSDGPVFGVAANKWFDGQLMPSTGEVRLVSAESGHILHKLTFPNEVHAAALTSEGSRLIVALNNGLVRASSRIEVYSTTSGLRTGTLDSPEGVAIRDFRREGDLLVADLADDNIAVWQLSMGPEYRLISPGQRVTSYDISPGHDRIVTALADGNAMIWDAKRGADLYTLRAYAPKGAAPLKDRVTDQAMFSADGTKLLTHTGGVLRSFNSIPWKDQPNAESKKGP